MIRVCPAVRSHRPERKREKRQMLEKPADTTEMKTHTASKHKELNEEHQRNVCMVYFTGREGEDLMSRGMLQKRPSESEVYARKVYQRI